MRPLITTLVRSKEGRQSQEPHDTIIHGRRTDVHDGGETATAFDLKETLKDLMPCKYAAIRLCERHQQKSAAALWKCGTTLAATPQEEIGKRRVAILKRYGAALN
jgi:hypothetical protein